jgi:hypothetical protein
MNPEIELKPKKYSIYPHPSPRTNIERIEKSVYR